MGLEVPTADQIGGLTTTLNYSEAEFTYWLAGKLKKLGFDSEHEVYAAPKFPGFRVGNEADAKRMAGSRANPDGRPIDLLAWRGGLTLVIECKVRGVEHGLGQVLLNGDIFKRSRLSSDQEMVMVLAAPDYVWHPRLPDLTKAVGIVPWVFWTGKQ